MDKRLDYIVGRRSIKKYKPDMVPREVIDQIIEAGLYAASAKGRQDPIIVAVTDPETRDRLSRANCKVGGWDPDFDPFYGAPVVLVVLAHRDWVNGAYDGSCVMENLMLAAHSLGIGSCWINRAREEFDQEEWADWLRSIGVEGDYEGVGHCVLGYADCEMPSPPPRHPGRVYWVE